MSDRLADIKAWVARQYKYAVCQMPQADANWLVAEVERLRKVIERLEAELALLYPREADHE